MLGCFRVHLATGIYSVMALALQDKIQISYCIATNFLISSQQTWRGFLMVSMTIERYISVAFPLRVELEKK